MRRGATIANRGRWRSGLSLVETVVSAMLVAVVLLGSMDLLGAVTRDRTATSDKIRGDLMAHGLMAEILSSRYVDEGALPLFGPELGEATGNRSSFDDVDDYNGWSASPPQDRNGAEMPNGSGWRHAATVEFVLADSPATVSLLDTGVKRITVVVQRNGRTMAKLVSLRTDKY
ncbi:MAG: hypothetical protein DCC67_10760 [Planctomycetota bacterium]|nr:MAG: hypothetical protein DCC67_10760 [Planctomycetota bacterium]